MFKATVFNPFISISVSQQVYNMAREIFPDRDFSSGYEMRDFLRMLLPQVLIDQVQMDPESSHFYAYLKLIKEDDSRLFDHLQKRIKLVTTPRSIDNDSRHSSLAPFDS
jgi:hypothetical protein